jgi:putative ABC transport system substrate-binding protein
MNQRNYRRFLDFLGADLNSKISAQRGQSVFILTGFVLATFLLTAHSNAAAAQAKVERIGVLHLGGVLATVVDGLRAGLKELGLEEGKQFELDVQDLKSDAKRAEAAAQKFERDKVKMIFSINATVTNGAMNATKTVPIVFTVGTDPVSLGYIKSFAQPGGRLTGVQYLARDLTGKRLEILKEFLPKLRQVVTFYDPSQPPGVESARLAREEAQRINIKLVERHVKSIDELNAALDALKAGEFGAYLYMADAMVVSQSQRIVDSALAKKLPTMFHDQIIVARGGLASYGQSYFEIGRRAAKYVQRVLKGVTPAEQRVETIEDVELAFNLATAKKIGVTIPPNVLVRAKKVFR